MEKLKEHDYEEYKDAVSKEEQFLIDEIGTQRYNNHTKK